MDYKCTYLLCLTTPIYATENTIEINIPIYSTEQEINTKKVELMEWLF